MKTNKSYNKNKNNNRFPLKRKSKVKVNLAFFLLCALSLAGLLWLYNTINKQPEKIFGTNQQPPESIITDSATAAAANADTFIANGQENKSHNASPRTSTAGVDTTFHKDVNFGLPAISSAEQLIKHFAYTLSYNEEHEQANWVAYRIKAEETSGTEARNDNFREDPAVLTGSSHPKDYLRSGYDRGHLVPAADMKWSKKAMSETFLMSNISPQDRSFNSGIWAKLEKQIRLWAVNNEEIYVVTGPVLKPGLPTIGENKVSIPEYFYKVVLDAQHPDLKAIGFIIPNAPGKTSFRNYAVSIDSVEKVTGIDFFPALPDALEEKLESEANINRWK